MRLALDTKRYVDFCRGENLAVERVRAAECIYLPCVTVAELRAGFLCGSKARENERVLTRFLNSPRVRTLYGDEQEFALGPVRTQWTVPSLLRCEELPMALLDVGVAVAARSKHKVDIPLEVILGVITAGSNERFDRHSAELQIERVLAGA